MSTVGSENGPIDWEATGWRPYSVNVELTLACDLRCKHCGSSAGRPRPDELTLAEWSGVFRDLAALGCEEACLLGGEPLLRPDWAELCDAVGDAGLRLVLITNGTRVDDAVVRRLAEMPQLDRVGVSLDAADPAVHDAIRGRRGSHARAWGALRRLRDAGIETGAITTLSRINLGELEGLRDRLVGEDLTWQLQCAALGGDRFASGDRIDRADYYRIGRFISQCRGRFTVDELPLAGSHDIGYHSERLGPTGELPEWMGCGAGIYTLGLLSDGGVKGCLSQHGDFVEANLRERPIAEIWRDPTLFARNRRFEPELLEGFCATCPHGATCRAGCANVTYTTTGRHYDNPYCFYRIEHEQPELCGTEEAS